MRWVNVVVPVTTSDSGAGLLGNMGVVDVVGEAGGERGFGGGTWDQDTETGRFGSTEEKEIDVTLVCS
jgi:hypothetical protein